jgi:hypothetical protein
MARRKSNSDRQLVQKRRTAFLEAKERIIIFCEGKNTEPEYFKAFKLVTATVKTIHVNQGDALRIAEEAIVQKEFHKDYDQYWLVFDKDATTDDRFNKAINSAKAKGFKVAYSNQAFEFWFLMHFIKHMGRMHRSGYAARLNKYLPFKYDKSMANAKRMFETLYPLQAKAIKNAESVYHSIGDHQNPAAEESSTTVFQLVQELNRFTN